MHGRRPPSIFLTKKNPADAGEMDGLMKPLASSSSMYAFIASDSGCDRGNTLPLVGIAPGSRSMAQSLDWCGGSWEAFDLLNASVRSWYSIGRSDMAGISDDEGDAEVVTWCCNCRHSFWQRSYHCWICLTVQEIQGLCLSSQGKPRITGFCGESIAKRRVISVWKEPTFRVSKFDQSCTQWASV